MDKNGKVYYREIGLGSDEWMLVNELKDEIIIDIKASGNLSYAKFKEDVHYLSNKHFHPRELNMTFCKATKKQIKDVYFGRGEVIIAA